jgi:hypothetical protein
MGIWGELLAQLSDKVVDYVMGLEGEQSLSKTFVGLCRFDMCL